LKSLDLLVTGAERRRLRDRTPKVASRRVWLCCLGLLVFSSTALAQTPPIQPQTPNVKIPPPLQLPSPEKIAIGREPLRPDEAVAIALKNQPDVGIARGNLLSSQGRVQQAASDLLPNFTANGSLTRSRTFRGGSGGGGSNQVSTSVNVDQLLFDFGRTRDALRQQEALERVSRQNLLRTNQVVARDVRQAFYNLVEDNANVTISEANVANRQRQLDQAQARLNSGLGSPSDVVQAKTGLADAAISLSSARTNALSSQITLAQLMGIDPRTPITPAPSTESPLDIEGDLQRLVETAMNNRPDIKAAQEQVTASKFAISFAQKGNLPRVTASAGLGSRGENDPLSTQTGTFSINVTWNFADSGFTAGAVKVARGNEEVARQNLIATTQRAISDVSQSYVDLQSALQRVELAQVGIANALELVRIAEGRFTGGIGTFLEVTSAQGSLVSAQRNLSQAQQDVERIRSQLRYAIGLG
jgi:outer membrane protein